LLERNPTIASSERAMAAANARIGVAIAGYFPTSRSAPPMAIKLVPQQAFHLGKQLWSFGLTSVSLPIFTGGLTSSQVAAARATYDQTVANIAKPC